MLLFSCHYIVFNASVICDIELTKSVRSNDTKMGKFGKKMHIIHIIQFVLNSLQRSSRKPLTCLHRATSCHLLKAQINWMEKLKNEGQGHSYKFSILKNVKNTDFS